jgi:PAS domain S-box-containing protein
MNSGAPSQSPEIDRLNARIAVLEAEVNRLRPEASEHAPGEALSRTDGARLAEVFEQAPAFIAVLRGARHVFERVNAAYYGVVGRRDLIGKPMAEALPELQGQGFEDLLTRVLETGEPYVGTGVPAQLRVKPESPPEQRYVDFVYAALRESDGTRSGVVSIGYDVTSRVVAEQALAAERARLRAVLDHAPVGIAVAEAPSGRLLFGNRRLEEIFRHPVYESPSVESYREWIVWKEDGTRLEPRDYPLAKAVCSGETADGVYLCERGDGSKAWLQFTAAPVRDSTGGVAGAVIVVTDVDAERRTRDVMREMNERLSLALEANRLGTWDWDIRSNQIAWGGYHYQLFGLAEAEFGGSFEDFLATLHPGDRSSVEAEIQTAIAARREEYRQEYRAVWPDGSIHWLEGRARFFYDQAGEPYRMLGVVQDISTRKEAEETLRSSEAQFRQIADSLPQLAWMTRPNGHHEWFNRRWYEYTGATFEECSGEGWANFFHPEDVSEADRRWRRSLELGGGYEVEYRCRRSDGAYRWFLGRAEAVRDEDGRILRWFGTCTDIDDQKQAEANLRGHRQWLEAVLDLLPTAVILVEPGTARVTFSNRAANAIAGTDFPKGHEAAEYTAAYRVFDKQGRVLGNDEMPGVRLARGEELRGVEVDWETARGRKTLIIHGTILPAMYGRDAIGVSAFSDVTELKAVERALRHSNEDLERFAYMASHDLQEPLRMVTSYSQLLARRYGDALDGTAKEFIETILSGTQRMSRMIQDLLLYARSATGDLSDVQSIDANIALQLALANLRGVIDDVKPFITYDDLPMVRAAEGPVAQVFQNLISNAVKYRRDGVTPEIHISARRDGVDCVFSVADNGQGIAPEHHHRLFQLFSRLHGREVSGTGIGLATCKRIVERHGGRVWVESQENVGSTFYFTLPV